MHQARIYNTGPEPPHTRRWLLAIILGGLVLRLLFALLPLGTHLLLLEDDAWMVTAIARNWAYGLGITADGVYPTNGFHPLYTLTLGAIPYVLRLGDDWGFTASLVICALLATLVIIPAFRLTRTLAGTRAALIAAALYAFNPFMVRLTVNGMETAMALLLFATTLWALYALDLRTVRANLVFALLTAATILTRLDASLLFAAVAGARFLWAWRERRLQREFPLLVLYVAATFALLVPYFWRNRVVFGSFGPSSGTALAYLHSYEGAYALSNILQPFFLQSAAAAEWVPSTAIMAVLVVVGAALLWWVLRRALWRALPLLLYLPLPAVYYGYLMQQSLPRYFVGFSLILMILLGWAVATLIERRPSGARRVAALGVVAALVALNTAATVQFWARQRSAPGLTQPTSYQAARWIAANLPPDAVIGAKNSGIYQYYSGHTVVNIDGKLNHEIVPVMERRELLPYLRAKGIDYLVDTERTLADHVQFYSAEFGPAPMHQLPSIGDRLRIYGELVLSSLRVAPKPRLDQRHDWRPNRSFFEVAPIVQSFERPNESENPVVLVRLTP
jgi:hypothetical protein